MQPAHTTRQRSFVKAVSWRIVGSIDTFVIAYLITGEMKFGAFIAGTEALTKIVLYFFHERGWAHIKWGTVKID
ncbi:MAG: DUF2061 domain-containing protein [Alphaproteobacteria bacterium]|nr:DUF2061 domain-containing protein [Alphaproteobacteria bacterium]